MSVLDYVTSFIDGRVRLRHPALKDAATAEFISGIVGSVEGITNVQTNPVTGSLLIFYDPAKLSREQLLELAEQGVAFLPGADAETDGGFGKAESCEDRDEGEAPGKPCALSRLAQKAPVDEVLQFITGRGATKFVNRTMLVALLASLAALPLGNRAIHSAAGGVMVGGVIQHLLAHRKSL